MLCSRKCVYDTFNGMGARNKSNVFNICSVVRPFSKAQIECSRLTNNSLAAGIEVNGSTFWIWNTANRHKLGCFLKCKWKWVSNQIVSHFNDLRIFIAKTVWLIRQKQRLIAFGLHICLQNGNDSINAAPSKFILFIENTLKSLFKFRETANGWRNDIWYVLRVFVCAGVPNQGSRVIKNV